MNRNTVHIDDLLIAGYSGFEPAVPAFAWDNIAKGLDVQNKRRGFIWWKAAAIALVIAGLSTLFYGELNKNNAVSDLSTNQTEKPIQNPQEVPLKDKANGSNESLNAESQKNQGSVQNNTVPKTHKMDLVPSMKKGVPEVEKANRIPEVNSIEETSSSKSFNHLATFGIRGEALHDANALNLESTIRLTNTIKPPTQILGGNWYAGVGAGQILSTTGFAVNPNLNNYVHKNFSQRMAEGEGLMAALNFSGNLAYKLSGKHFVFGGVNYYQRRNSLNFNFKDEAPALNSVGNVKKDIFGNYPIKGYISAGSGIEVNFRGTNTITSIEIPVGWTAQYKIAPGVTFIPTAGLGLGFLSLNASNSSLNYQLLEVEKVNRNWYRKSYTIMNTSAGLYKDLGLRIKWGVNAAAGYTLSQMYIPGSPVRPRAFTGGLTTQIIWRLD